MRISDWSSDVCSSDLNGLARFGAILLQLGAITVILRQFEIENNAFREVAVLAFAGFAVHYFLPQRFRLPFFAGLSVVAVLFVFGLADGAWLLGFGLLLLGIRSEEHTSELQSLMRISFAVFFLKKKINFFFLNLLQTPRYTHTHTLFHYSPIYLTITVIQGQFEIENNAFREVAVLDFAGFAVHYLLPQRFRLPFFAGLSVVAVLFVFGLADGAWLLGFGLLLLGICHLPFSLWLRIGLLVGAGLFAAAARIEWIPGPWSQAIWPILASMFMFRLIVYLYDMRQEKASFSRSVSYFFMLPNVCFPMFPVVDYKGFRRSYYDIDEHRIYQIGVDWMVRGILHLILYRIIYYYWTIGPAEVIDPDTLTQYLVTNFLLYLRISGDFHLITGMLHLFGFNLTPTHHHYCLSSSFTDFWRRINIYWKDFMMKIFYYPLFFKLRRYGDVPAIVVATVIVFLLTWLLHSYQWFWLRGDFPIIWQDGIFWMTLALLVVVGALREFRRGRARTLGTTQETLDDKIKRGLRTVALFFAICILWSVWTSESLAQWSSIWNFFWQGIPSSGRAVPTLFLAVAAMIFVAAILFGRESAVEKRLSLGGLFPGKDVSVARSTVETIILLGVIAPIGLPQV